MDAPRGSREKLAIFRRCFTGLGQVYGTRDLGTGRARQVKQPVTDRVLLDHLQGRQPYGVYLLVGDRTKAAVVDFDHPDAGPPLAFIGRAEHYGVHVYLERSKSKGWHVWAFMDSGGVPASKIRLVTKMILAEIGASDTEVFPKQDRLAGNVSYGNFIYAPLFGALGPKVEPYS